MTLQDDNRDTFSTPNNEKRVAIDILPCYTLGMKKIISLAVAITALSVSAFGQEGLNTWNGNRRMAATINPGPLVLMSVLNGFGIDVGFEYATSQSVSVKANSRFATVRFSDTLADSETTDELKAWLLRVGLEGRWYPQGAFVQGWFFSGNLQFQNATGSLSGLSLGEMVSESATRYALSFFPGIGYKLVFKSNQRTSFALELTGDIGFMILHNNTPGPEGWPEAWLLGTAGPRAALLLGAAF